MSYARHPAIQDLARHQTELERRAPVSNVSQALLSLGIMLDERLEQISQAVGALALGTEHVTIHEETTETTFGIVESGDAPQLATSELEDGSIAITVLRSEDGKPAAQIRLTKLRALELGQHFVAELQCQVCNGTGIVGGRVGGNSVCPRCHGGKIDPAA